MTSNGEEQYSIATLSTACFIAEDPPNPDQQEPTNDDLTTTQATNHHHHPQGSMRSLFRTVTYSGYLCRRVL
jgi:hypothetical protein